MRVIGRIVLSAVIVLVAVFMAVVGEFFRGIFLGCGEDHVGFNDGRGRIGCYFSDCSQLYRDSHRRVLATDHMAIVIFYRLGLPSTRRRLTPPVPFKGPKAPRAEPDALLYWQTP